MCKRIQGMWHSIYLKASKEEIYVKGKWETFLQSDKFQVRLVWVGRWFILTEIGVRSQFKVWNFFKVQLKWAAIICTFSLIIKMKWNSFGSISKLLIKYFVSIVTCMFWAMEFKFKCSICFNHFIQVEEKSLSIFKAFSWN